MSRGLQGSCSRLAAMLMLLTASVAGAEEASTPLSAADAYALPRPPAGLELRYGPEPRQFGELRLPDGPGPHPVAILIHGGCWLEAYDGSYMESLADALTDFGFASWQIGFRRIGAEGGGWPTSFLDVAAAADRLRVLAEDHPLDPERVIAVGHSAGGQLALWLAARSRLPSDSPLHRDDPIDIDAVLALAAAADLEGLSERETCGNAATRLLDGSPAQQAERYAQASPMQLIPMQVPQILVNGALDRTWSEAADAYYERARAAGAPVERRVMPEAGHFELVVPNAAHWDETVGAALHELAEMLRQDQPAAARSED